MANKLASISGWQQERRRALALLTAQIKRASARCDWATVDALHAARRDVRASLVDLAQAEITESTHMRYAHSSWLQVAA